MPAEPAAPSPAGAPGCPPTVELLDALEGRLSGPHADGLRAHAERCSTCAQLLIGLSDTFAGLVPDATTTTAKAAHSTSPRFVAEFRLIRPLGHGAMGEVFLARDTFLGRLVALKFLTAGEASPAARERFYVEARAVARLQHPNVVTLYRAGEEQGRRYLVSELVRGQSLERWPKPLPWRQVLEIGLGLARGLAAAHQHGVLHRDIKPANVIGTPGGEVKILDFGLAKLMAAPSDGAAAADGLGAPLDVSQSDGMQLSQQSLTRSGALMGTPLYMAPELWRGEPATTQADVYALGALLYELCTGHPPHRADTMAALGFKIIEQDAKPLAVAAPGMDSRLAAVIERCLQRDPVRRFASGQAVQEALERIATRGPAMSRRFAIASLIILLGIVVTAAALGIRRDRHTRKQAELAQRLGQEISAMEWLLRSARQLPPHDLAHEKAIVRQRMAALEAQLQGYGDLGTGLAHYALGRGHLALHEYPEALAQLRLAVQQGNVRPEVHYALGLVLGKHFEQAMHEARLSGGGDWARKQLKEFEPKYLTPAIASLLQSRAAKLDAPQYLEGLIAYYQRDYEGALRQAEAARSEAPWLYEATKLAGDVHLERALQAKDRGHYDEAEQEFTGAVRSYEQAAAAGQSDGEIYEGLAEAWIRQVEMAVDRGRPVEAAYAAAVAAADRILLVDPQNLEGPLKKAAAAERTMRATGTGLDSASRAQECMMLAEQVLKKAPGHPYASELAANCSTILAGMAGARGGDPEPLLRKALGLLEPTVQRYPHFLWGINDLAMVQIALGIHLQMHGSHGAKEMLQKSVKSASAAVTLDPSYITALNNILWAYTYLPDESRSAEELHEQLARTDEWLARCKGINLQYMQCFNNYFQVYARASARLMLAGQDPGQQLQVAQANLAETRRLGGDVLDAEQVAALTHLVDAQSRMQKRQDPGQSLAELQHDLEGCFKIAPTDAMCRTLAAQGDWVQADYLAVQGKPNRAALEAARAKAELATQGPEPYPEAWSTLAESQLRLARQAGLPAARQQALLIAGLAALDKLFAINPNHAQGLAVRGALLRLQAEGEADAEKRSALRQDAVKSLKRALALDPLLARAYGPLLQGAAPEWRGGRGQPTRFAPFR